MYVDVGICMCIYLFTYMCTYMNLCMAQKPHLNLSCAGWFIAPDGLAWLGLGGNWCGGWGARSQTGRGLVSAGFAQAFLGGTRRWCVEERGGGGGGEGPRARLDPAWSFAPWLPVHILF